MRFSVEQVLPGPVERVEDALLDPAFLTLMASLPKLGAPQLLDLTENGTTVRRRVRYRFAGDLSPAVTAVVDPAKLTWVEDATVDRVSHRTTFRILPDHYGNRLKCSGTFRLEEVPGGVRRVLDGDLRVSFPLVGGKVERAIVSGLREHAALEADALRDWMAQQGG
ncbi:MAG TPA: DUF2505 family protein [Acidimicrobiales bacterium]|nr:DUF2505 family protein [Acidimicrobiales bacterium]